MKARLSTQVATPYRIRASISACIATLISIALLPCTALGQRGDMNCDGTLNVADVPLFIEALVNPGTFGGCDLNRADMNADSVIDGLDIQPFVAALMAPPSCPTCYGGQLCCDGVCTEVNLDPSNCGSCGHQCGPGEICLGGCQPAEPCCGP